MSCLNINPPDSRGLQRKLNQMCDRVEAINEASMVENQQYVRRVNTLRGEGDAVDLETDTSYNNRPQAGFEAATQSFSPMVESSTPRKLVVSLQTANKLCCKRKCENHINCKKKLQHRGLHFLQRSKTAAEESGLHSRQEYLDPPLSYQ